MCMITGRQSIYISLWLELKSFTSKQSLSVAIRMSWALQVFIYTIH